MPHAYIGIGSNLENPEQQVRLAIGELKLLPETDYMCNSSCYLSKPVGPSDQPDYVNAVARINTQLPANKLLDCLQSIELKQGRVRKQERWGPRIIDLDILLYGNDQINNENLIIPHQEMHNRDFVLFPLHEINSELIIPGKGPLAELLGKFNKSEIKKIN